MLANIKRTYTFRKVTVLAREETWAHGAYKHITDDRVNLTASTFIRYFVLRRWHCLKTVKPVDFSTLFSFIETQLTKVQQVTCDTLKADTLYRLSSTALARKPVSLINRHFTVFNLKINLNFLAKKTNLTQSLPF